MNTSLRQGQTIDDARFVLSLYGVFPSLLGQFTSVTYPRWTGGKLRRSYHVTQKELAARNNEA